MTRAERRLAAVAREVWDGHLWRGSAGHGKDAWWFAPDGTSSDAEGFQNDPDWASMFGTIEEAADHIIKVRGER